MVIMVHFDGLKLMPSKKPSRPTKQNNGGVGVDPGLS